ncbi:MULTISPECIES: cupin domain-containing protein [unclassified Pseudomonas]|uniref:cupin domain-containing protein n=1 Tax=unclassified Pseudomonas TaxID=196821 RepID=UPI002E812F9C|nr:cupin domain-containing protein [Pseudomonas sp. 10C3]MEE3508501.1 cupin domain-containing protein [Pseudomonas sp. 10C3]
MMRAQRVVTGHDAQGRSCIVSSGPVAGDESFTHIPGFSAALFWKTDAQPQVGGGAPDPLSHVTSVLPVVAGTSVMLVSFPPESTEVPVDADPLAADEMNARVPGLAQTFEADAPGFHRTDTIDYGVIVDGELTLLLDDGESALLKAGDVVVQMGTRHAWRNTGNSPARVMFVMVGATRR